MLVKTECIFGIQEQLFWIRHGQHLITDDPCCRHHEARASGSLQKFGSDLSACWRLVRCLPLVQPEAYDFSARCLLAVRVGLRYALNVSQFRMIVANVHEIRSLGPTVTGNIASGKVRVGEHLALIGASGRIEVQVTAIQKFQESLVEATVEDSPVGISLSGIERDQIRNRDVLVGR